MPLIGILQFCSILINFLLTRASNPLLMLQEGRSIKRITYSTRYFLMWRVLLFIELVVGNISVAQQKYSRYYSTSDGLPSDPECCNNLMIYSEANLTYY